MTKGRLTGLFTLCVLGLAGGILGLAGCSAVGGFVGLDKRPQPQVIAVLHRGFASDAVRAGANDLILETALAGGSIDVKVLTSGSVGNVEEVNFSDEAGRGLFRDEDLQNSNARDEAAHQYATAATNDVDEHLRQSTQADGADLLGALLQAIDTAQALDDQKPRSVHLIMGGGAHRTSAVDLFVENDPSELAAWINEQVSALGDVSGIEVSISGVAAFEDAEQAPAITTVEQVQVFWDEVCDNLLSVGADQCTAQR